MFGPASGWFSNMHNEIIEEKTNDEQLLNAFVKLRRRVEITKNARFQANLRLARRHRMSLYVISLLSLLVIVLAMLPITVINDEDKKNFVSVATVFLSVYIIIITWMEASGNFYKRGEELHQNARKIHKIHQDLLMTPVDQADSRERIEKLQEKYQEALDSCVENHENVDYRRVMIEKPELFLDYYSWGRANIILIFWNKFAIFLISYFWIFIPAFIMGVALYVIYQLLGPQ